jgi:hypothetical protein
VNLPLLLALSALAVLLALTVVVVRNDALAARPPSYKAGSSDSLPVTPSSAPSNSITISLAGPVVGTGAGPETELRPVTIPAPAPATPALSAPAPVPAPVVRHLDACRQSCTASAGRQASLPRRLP